MSEAFNNTIKKFIMYMDEILAEVSRRTKPVYNIGSRLLRPVEVRCCAFVDNVAVLAGFPTGLQRSMTEWNKVLEKRGMRMNI